MRAASKDSQGRNLASQETGIFGLQAGEDVNVALLRWRTRRPGKSLSGASRDLLRRLQQSLEDQTAPCHQDQETA